MLPKTMKIVLGAMFCASFTWTVDAENRRQVIDNQKESSVVETVNAVDFSKILNYLNTGEDVASLTITWGDDLALDNLVSGVRFDGKATVGDVLYSALENDERLYALFDRDYELLACGFDTNGDNSAAIKVGDVDVQLNNGVGYIDGASDYSSATGSSQYDHWKVNGDEGRWVFTVNGKEATYQTEVGPGDNVAIEYVAAGTEPSNEKPYLFYLHPFTEQGVWMLEDCVVNTENGKMAYFPMIANVLDDAAYLYGAGISAEIYEPDGVTTSNCYSAYVTNGTKGAMSMRISVSKPQEALVRPYLNIRKDWGTGKAEVKRVYGGVDSKVSTIVAHPLTNISLEGIEPGDVIEIDNMGVAIIKPVYEPADADFTGFTPVFGNTDIATFYSSVNAVVAHSAGETTLTLADLQGNEYGTYTIKVKGVDPNDKPDDEFLDGLVFLNEEWFTHTSGSLNYIDAQGNIYYRAYANQNDNMAFGATSQFGMTYAGKYVIMSKQAWDGGDTRPVRSGGRVVVFDATTFKHIGAIDDIGGDGRAAVGVNPSKVYLSTTTGIRVMDLDNITIADENIAGITVKRNSGQVGDMVKAGKYVFAANVGTGLEIIDTETDLLVKSIAETGIQTVALSKDGRVWYATANKLYPVDPATFEVGDPYSVPGSISCSSGSWRHGNLMSSTKENVLLWGKGSYNGNDGALYRWNIDEVADPSTLAPVFVRDSDFNKAYGYGYGSPAYDDRTDTYIFATTTGFGAAALNNWYHFINASTGEVKKTIKLSSYWWFPAMPIVPDKHAAEISLETLNPNMEDGTIEVNLADYVADADDHDWNINISLDGGASGYAEESVNNGPAAMVTLDGTMLTVEPKYVGKHYFTLTAESNGRVTSKDIEVKVDATAGINALEADLYADIWQVYDLAGKYLGLYRGEANSTAVKDSMQIAGGIYILKNNKETVKLIVK